MARALPVVAPVSAVTVYSDRACVVRVAKVGGAGQRRVELVVVDVPASYDAGGT